MGDKRPEDTQTHGTSGSRPSWDPNPPRLSNERCFEGRQDVRGEEGERQGEEAESDSLGRSGKRGCPSTKSGTNVGLVDICFIDWFDNHI